MLIEFSVENYKSFKDKTTLSFRVAEGLTRYDDYPVIKTGVYDEEGKDLILLPAIALYGANASGKSNFIEALGVFQQLMLKGDGLGEDLHDRPWENLFVPATFIGNNSSIIQFSVKLLWEKTIYHYQLSIDVKKSVVLNEELGFYAPVEKKQKIQQYHKIFMREGIWKVMLFDTHIHSKLSGELIEGQHYSEAVRNLKDTQPKNKTLLSQAENIHLFETNTLTKNFLEASKSILFLEGTKRRVQYRFGVSSFDGEQRPQVQPFLPQSSSLVQCIQKTKLKKQLKLLLKDADFSIEDLKLIPLHNAKQTFLVQFFIQALAQDKKTTKKNLALEDQSNGTLVFLALISHLLVLTDSKRSSISIIDELEESLHPKLTRAVVRLFNETAAQKKNCGQLLFSTHDTQLMDDDLLRPDQIYFIEKNKGSNVSSLYRATDFKKIDWNDDKYKGRVKILYEHGSLGASPRIYGLHLEEEEWA